jgi:hypothetical protein
MSSNLIDFILGDLLSCDNIIIFIGCRRWSRRSRASKLRIEPGRKSSVLHVPSSARLRHPSPEAHGTVCERRSQELPVAEVEGSVGGDGLWVGHNIQCLPVPRVYHRLDLVFWYHAMLSPF